MITYKYKYRYIERDIYYGKFGSQDYGMIMEVESPIILCLQDEDQGKPVG